MSGIKKTFSNQGFVFDGKLLPLLSVRLQKDGDEFKISAKTKLKTANDLNDRIKSVLRLQNKIGGDNKKKEFEDKIAQLFDDNNNFKLLEYINNLEIANANSLKQRFKKQGKISKVGDLKDHPIQMLQRKYKSIVDEITKYYENSVKDRAAEIAISERPGNSLMEYTQTQTFLRGGAKKSHTGQHYEGYVNTLTDKLKQQRSEEAKQTAATTAAAQAEQAEAVKARRKARKDALASVNLKAGLEMVEQELAAEQDDAVAEAKAAAAQKVAAKSKKRREGDRREIAELKQERTEALNKIKAAEEQRDEKAEQAAKFELLAAQNRISAQRAETAERETELELSAKLNEANAALARATTAQQREETKRQELEQEKQQATRDRLAAEAAVAASPIPVAAPPTASAAAAPTRPSTGSQQPSPRTARTARLAALRQQGGSPAPARDIDIDEFDSADEYENAESKAANQTIQAPPTSQNLGAGKGTPAASGTPPPAVQVQQPPPPAPLAPPLVANAQAVANAANIIGQAFRRRQRIRAAAPPPPPPPVPVIQADTTEGMTLEDRLAEGEEDVRQKEMKDPPLPSDDIPDISKYGYDKQVYEFAISQSRDFTYSQELVKSSKDAPSQDANERKKQVMKALQIYGYTIDIMKPKTNDYEEAVEIMTFIYLAIDKFRMEREWKRAMTMLPDMLENIGLNADDITEGVDMTNQQLGMITQFTDPQILANLAAQQGGAAAPVVQPQPPPQPAGPVGPVGPVGGGAAQPQPPPQPAGPAGPVGGAAAQPMINRNQRLPNAAQGIQRVRIPKAQRPRPQKKAKPIDIRPRTDVNRMEFKMKNSRINANLLFTNLTKQNPRPQGEDSIFKKRPVKKTRRRLTFNII